ncbi:MAG: alpha/beta hydrolase [Erythrobacter sp.]
MRYRFGLAVGIGCLAATLVIGVLGARAADARRAQLQEERSLATTRHGTIEYSTFGECAPVLVIHGAGGGFDQGRLLANAVGGDAARFIAVSRFGYLGSTLPEDASTTAQAEAIVDLLDALAIKQVGVLAMSGGVPPALKLAEIFPERTGLLVLLSSAPFTPFSQQIEDRPIPTWAYSALLGNDAAYWALSKVARGPLKSAFDARPELLRIATVKERLFVEQLVDGFLPASERLQGVANEGAAIDPAMRYDLTAIRAPALVIHAQDDRLNPFSVAERIVDGLPNAELIGLESGGHLLLGHHAELRERISGFFGGRES